MLIPLNELYQRYDLKINGILHIGAHECEELKSYITLGVQNKNIYWVEAMEDKVNLMKRYNVGGEEIKIFQGLIDLEDNKEVVFNVSNNGQSSSILEFGSHAVHHPSVKMIDRRKLKTIRLDTFIQKNNVPMKNINFLNLDIQGKELDALKSMGDYINHIQYIYSEVNTEEVYKNVPLLKDIDKFLESKGFKRVDVKMYRNCGWGDAFYIRNA